MYVVMLNWARPANVRELVERYLGHPAVTGITVVDNAPRNQPLLYHASLPAGLTYVRSSSDLGLYSRFAAAALAPIDPVLLVDDDIQPADKTISNLLEKWRRQPSVLHGLFGRDPDADGTYRPGHTVYGACPVVLTRMVLCTRRSCALALAIGTRLLDTLPGTPRGNGEDIVLSYANHRATGLMNQAWPLPYTNRDYDDANAISVRFKGHAEHRTAVTRWCQQELLTKENPWSW